MSVLIDGSSLTGVPSCNSKSQVGDLCTLNPDQMRPSQFGIGAVEAVCKQGLFESMSSSELEKYLSSPDRRVNIVVGRKDHFHVLDGHHMSVALLNSDIPAKEKIIYCNVVQNWNDLDGETFWQNMVSSNYVWLFDEKGLSPLAPEFLPGDLEDMLDDPFRTLAWMLQDAGGFLKTGVNFEDFAWANFLRNNINLHDSSFKSSPLVRVPSEGNILPLQASLGEIGSQWTWCQVRPNSEVCLHDEVKKLSDALPLALDLARSSLASNLPGYGSGVIKPANCGDKIDLDFIAEIGMMYAKINNL